MEGFFLINISITQYEVENDTTYQSSSNSDASMRST